MDSQDTGWPGLSYHRVQVGAQDCWSMGHRTSEVVSMVLRVNSELLRQGRKGLWGETVRSQTDRHSEIR